MFIPDIESESHPESACNFSPNIAGPRGSPGLCNPKHSAESAGLCNPKNENLRECAKFSGQAITVAPAR